MHRSLRRREAVKLRRCEGSGLLLTMPTMPSAASVSLSSLQLKSLEFNEVHDKLKRDRGKLADKSQEVNDVNEQIGRLTVS